MKHVLSTAVCALLVHLLILCAPGPLPAQELYFYGGGIIGRNASDHSYAWGMEYLEGIGENFAASFSYLNEGHLSRNHRDGIAGQLWIRKQYLKRQLSLGIGMGPYRFFDTRTLQGDQFSDAHGWGGIVSGTASWYTESRWVGQLRLNWITTRHGPDTFSVLAGIGYQLDPPPREGPIARASAPPEMRWKHEVTAYAGLTILNSSESEKSVAGSLEYRLNFLRHFDWTAAWVHEADDRIARRDGLISQFWLVRPFMEDRLSLAFGIGPYIQLDEHHPPQDGEGGIGHVSVMVSASANYRFTEHWSMRLTWSRLATNYDRDADIILFGPGYRF